MKTTASASDVAMNKDKQKEQQTQLVSEEQLQECQQLLQAEKEKVLRAQADYQNLLRRNQEDRVKFTQLANVELLTALLQPLDHLNLAAKQLNDSGLNMVVQQFEKTLAEFGIEEIPAEGKSFDVETMEVVENSNPSADMKKLKVTAIRQKGFRLNGKVIRHVKVVVA